jgi:Tol biopolymer transport system component
MGLVVNNRRAWAALFMSVLLIGAATALASPAATPRPRAVSVRAAAKASASEAASSARHAVAGRIAVPLAVRFGGEGSGGMVLIDPSGRRIATLTRPAHGREDSAPAWSPDGKWLAFTRTVDGRRSFQIYVMRADGTRVQRITRGRFDSDPAWAPDGKWIAYRASGVLRIVHPDGTGGRVVPTRGPTEVGFPSWSPGGRIAYSYWWVNPYDWPRACRQAGSWCGYVVSSRLDGSQRRRVIHGRDAHWSPGGRAIVYTGPDGGVYRAPGAGGAGGMLGRGYLAGWSRDGNQIINARMGNMPSQDSVWIMNRDGRGAHRILVGGSDPAWRP